MSATGLPAIEVVGATTHNLKQLSTTIPTGALTVVTGVSGSGKSSLVFDTLAVEGIKRYAEPWLPPGVEPDDLFPQSRVQEIRHLPPVVSLNQALAAISSRDVVGDLLQVTRPLAEFMALQGRLWCPTCDQPVTSQPRSAVIEGVMSLPERTRLLVLAPLARSEKGRHTDLLQRIVREGYLRARVNGDLVDAATTLELSPHQPHTIEAVVDRLVLKPGVHGRLQESLEAALNLGQGHCVISVETPNGWSDRWWSVHLACQHCGACFPQLDPRCFQPRHPAGMCPACEGWGRVLAKTPKGTRAPTEAVCAECAGERLGAVGRAVRWCDRSFAEWLALPLEQFVPIFAAAELSTSDPLDAASETALSESPSLSPSTSVSASPSTSTSGSTSAGVSVEASADTNDGTSKANSPADDVIEGRAARAGSRDLAAIRLRHLIDSRAAALVQLGLGYLSLARPLLTLSSGELQRVRLAAVLTEASPGVVLLLDEPTQGLHPAETASVIATLQQLKRAGQTIVVVEHDPEVMAAADFVIELGPGAGQCGGTVMAQGSPDEIQAIESSPTGMMLRQKDHAPIPATWAPNGWLRLQDCRRHSLTGFELTLPLGGLVTIAGVSGSGKSTLVFEELLPALKSAVDRLRGPGSGASGAAARTASDGLRTDSGGDARLTGAEQIRGIASLGSRVRGARATQRVAGAMGVSREFQQLLAHTSAARVRGWTASRFSVVSGEGVCPSCHGRGTQQSRWTRDWEHTCRECQGRRFDRQTLTVHWKGRSIADLESLSVEEAAQLFSAWRRIGPGLLTMVELGLGYLRLDQPLASLSGGEWQRLRLARELSRAGETGWLYVFDEPTIGLQGRDVELLLTAFRRLIAAGHTVLTIEHDRQLLAASDWIIELGPGSGAQGGRVIAAGSPWELAQGDTVTGRCLAGRLSKWDPKLGPELQSAGATHLDAQRDV
jgi:excinuclease ABC subunit A